MENEKPVLDYGSRTLTTGKAKTGLPDALAKACVDDFEYALGLRDGTILFFDRCDYVPGSEWIHIRKVWQVEDASSVGSYTGKQLREGGAKLGSRLLPIQFGRGVDIRLADVTWAADSPWGN